MEKYLKEHYYDQISNLLNEARDRTHVALHVEYVLYFDFFYFKCEMCLSFL